MVVAGCDFRFIIVWICGVCFVCFVVWFDCCVVGGVLLLVITGVVLGFAG